MTKQTMKRYVISSLVTFLTGFSIVLLGEIDNITLESFKDGSIIGVAFACARAGVKAVLEYFINIRKK